MLQAVNDLRVQGKGLSFETKLPKSFLALLVSSLAEYGVKVKCLREKGGGGVIEIVTSHGKVEMKGSFSVHDVKHKLHCEIYGVLNERFDKRVDLLHSKGYHYYRQYTCFAKSERNAQNGLCIPNAAIMYADDFMFRMKLEQL